MEWHTGAQLYLARLGFSEWTAWRKRRNRKKTDRFSPSEYHRTLVDLLGRNDEKGFKAYKLETGYASELGV